MAFQDKSKGRIISDTSLKDDESNTGTMSNKENEHSVQKRVLTKERPPLAEKMNKILNENSQENDHADGQGDSKAKNVRPTDNGLKEKGSEASLQTNKSVHKERHRHVNCTESGSNASNKTNGATDNSVDLRTEYEDALQQRMTGKLVNCCDMNCTGKCKKYTHIHGTLNHVDDRMSSMSSRTSSETLNGAHSISHNRLEGYACIERMLDHFQVNDYILCSTIGKGSFSKVKLGRKKRKYGVGERNIFKNNENHDKSPIHRKESQIWSINSTVAPTLNTTSEDFVIRKDENEWFAIKIIPRNLRYNSINKENKSKREARIFKEAFITSLLSNNHIIKIIDFYYNVLHFFMIYEYIEGQSLLNLIRKKKYLTENESKRIFRQLVCGVQYLHDNFVVHRDLKIENVLIRKDGTVKIIDFGLSNFYNKEYYLNTFCGSLQFAAPELLKGIVYHGPEIDVWSLGIILFVMVNGKLPFDDKEIAALHTKIKKGKYKWNINPTSSLETLLAHMIQLDPLLRYSLKKVAQSEWLFGINCHSCRGTQSGIISDKNQDYHRSRGKEGILPDHRNNQIKESSVHSSFLTILNTIAMPKSQFNLTSVSHASNTKPYFKDFSEIGLESIAVNMARILADHYKKIPDYILKCDREEMMHRFVKDLRVKRSCEPAGHYDHKANEHGQNKSRKPKGNIEDENKTIKNETIKDDGNRLYQFNKSKETNKDEDKRYNMKNVTHKKSKKKETPTKKNGTVRNKKSISNITKTDSSTNGDQDSCFTGGTDSKHSYEHDQEHFQGRNRNNPLENYDELQISELLSAMPGGETNISLTRNDSDLSKIRPPENNSVLTDDFDTHLSHFFKLYEVKVHKGDLLDMEEFTDKKYKIVETYQDYDYHNENQHPIGRPSSNINSYYTCHISFQNRDLIFTLHFYCKNSKQYLCARRKNGDEKLFKQVIGWLKEILQA